LPMRKETICRLLELIEDRYIPSHLGTPLRIKYPRPSSIGLRPLSQRFSWAGAGLGNEIKIKKTIGKNKFKKGTSMDLGEIRMGKQSKFLIE
jgi:hypothetical protein